MDDQLDGRGAPGEGGLKALHRDFQSRDLVFVPPLRRRRCPFRPAHLGLGLQAS